MAEFRDKGLQGKVAAYHQKQKARPWILLFLWSVLVAGLVAYMTLDIARGQERQSQIDSQQDILFEALPRVQSLEEAVDRLRDQLQNCKDPVLAQTEYCAEPVVPPAKDIDPEVTFIEQTLSESDIRTVVSTYCRETGECKGEDATAAQVATAVSTYCDANGKCAGADGATGATGAVGPQGPGPSDAQIASAVSTYCSIENRCRGPVGPAGPTCPEGWEASPLTVVTAGGTQEIYTCHQQTPPEEEPTP